MSVVQAFDRAADYDAHADVQRIVAARLADQVVALAPPPGSRVLEIGCGTGFLGAALIDRLPGARWLMTDVAPAMLARARDRFGGRSAIDYAILDGEAPGHAGGFDLIVSSLAAQWFADLPAAIDRWRGLLAPGGQIAFTTLAAGSFAEWRTAHGDLSFGTADYPTVERLAAIGLDVAIETLPVQHADAHDFLRSVKAIGAATPRPGHRPLTPAQLRTVMARFDAAGATARYVVATCIGGAGRQETTT